MITRGYLAGEIIDLLSDVGSKANTRSNLGLTDINRYAEDFFKELLNLLYGYSLRNVNEERCNSPGIDLLDERTGVAFQVTVTKKSQKINSTLEKVIKLESRPTSLWILIIGDKQGTYDAVDTNLCAELGFSVKNIIDLDDLCRQAMGLPIDKLSSVHALVRKNTLQLRVELEIPTADGRFPTSALTYFESIPKPTQSDFTIFFTHQQKRHAKIKHKYEASLEMVQKDFLDLTKRLLRLPRVSREVLVWLIEHRDRREDCGERGGISQAYVKKMSRWDGLDDDLLLLRHEGLIDFREPDNEESTPAIALYVGGESDYFWDDFTDYVESTKSGYIRPLVHLDFSAFVDSGNSGR